MQSHRPTFRASDSKGHATRNDIVDDIVDDPSSTMDFNVAKIASARASSTKSLTYLLTYFLTYLQVTQSRIRTLATSTVAFLRFCPSLKVLIGGHFVCLEYPTMLFLVDT